MATTDQSDQPVEPTASTTEADGAAAPKAAKRTRAAKADGTTADKPAKKAAAKKTSAKKSESTKAPRASKKAAAAAEASADSAGAPADDRAAAPTGDAASPTRPAPFSVVFQPADIEQAPARPTRSRRASAPVTTAEADEPAAIEAPAAAEAGDEDDRGPRRRRRGGKGRRTRTGEESGADAATQDGETTDDDGEDGAESPDATAGDSTPSARRRRRRRRAGSGANEHEDPPGTVTRVREPRQRDEVVGVKGSTRLEAKKQRRREGREAGRRRTVITEAEFLARRESVERVMVVREIDGRTQIAVLEDGVLVEHYVSRETNASMAGNVYLGRIQNVLPSMEAAFVDIGKGRNAVLYAGEVNWDAAGLEVNAPKRIENALKSGDPVLVQVTKDPIGHKGARLTSQISLPGRYLVYVPEGNMTGISRKLPDTERTRLKAILREVVPDTAGVIVRTAAEGASEEELRADVERLTRAWERITAAAETATAKKASSGGAPQLLHGEPDLTVRVIRDIFNEDFASLVVSGEAAWTQVEGYVNDVAPDLAARVVRWTGERDVFAEHRVDEQLAKALDRKVWLPSGGSLVIDRTEAMTVIDVNTGKFIGSGGNLEETVTKNNIEAAEEIVRQLRLRDIGGIIVIDFIDMVLESNRDLVVRRLLECLGRDRTKHQVAEVTSLGLVQMTRKRVGSGLLEVFSTPCEHCGGRGLIVHTHPIDRAPEPAPSGGRARGGRRRGEGAPEVAAPTGNGPTAAQIAAAAHAAALKASDVVPGDDGGDESLEGEHTAYLDVVEDLDLEPIEEPPSEPIADPEPVASGRRRKRGRVVAPAGPPRPAGE